MRISLGHRFGCDRGVEVPLGYAPRADNVAFRTEVVVGTAVDRSSTLGPGFEVRGPLVSVVVPTRNRTTRLLLTLTSLVRQTLAPEMVEIVVANDAPTSSQVDDVLLRLGRSTNIRVVHAGGQGVSHARNLGARSSKGKLLLFLDDDTIASPDMLERHVIAHSHSTHVVAHGGVIDLTAFKFSNDPVAADPALVGARGRTLTPDDLPMSADLVSTFGPRRSFIEKACAQVADDPARYGRLRWLLCVGTNTSMSRDLFQRVGQFDKHFGDLWGGEDLELGLRLAGVGVTFTQIDALGYHVPMVRREVEEKLRRFWTVAAQRHGEPRLKAVADFLLGKITLDELASRLDPTRSEVSASPGGHLGHGNDS